MGSSINNSLHEIMKDSLSEFTLADDKLGLNSWSTASANFLKFCERNSVITQTELCALVTERINKLGRASYRMHIDKKIPPDHTMSPHALAFAMRSGELNEAELSSIKFDHEADRKTFFRDVGSEFPHTVLQLLRNA